VTRQRDDTSPICEAIWVCERILVTDPPPPDQRARQSSPGHPGSKNDPRPARQTQSRHRCASCHKSFDPPGFGVRKNFDAGGKWRDHYRQLAGQELPAWCDRRTPATTLEKRARIETFDEFRTIIGEERTAQPRTSPQQLLVYADGAKFSSPIDAVISRSWRKLAIPITGSDRCCKRFCRQ